MADRTFDARRVMSGTWGKLWLDGEALSQTSELEAKAKLNKEKVHLGDTMAVDSKTVSVEYTGSVKLYRIDNSLAVKIGEQIKQGIEPRFTLVSALKDPDSWGSERVALTGVSFDEYTVTQWARGKIAEGTYNFTFTGYEYL